MKKITVIISDEQYRHLAEIAYGIEDISESKGITGAVKWLIDTSKMFEEAFGSDICDMANNAQTIHCKGDNAMGEKVEWTLNRLMESEK